MRPTMLASLILLAGLASARGAAAQIPPVGEDNVGIFTTETGGSWFMDAEQGQTRDVYLVFFGLSREGLAGWELGLEVLEEGAVLLQAFLYGADPINAQTPPSFQVVLGEPLTTPGAFGTFCVARLTYLILAQGEIHLLIVPVASAPWPADAGPAYLDPAGAEEVVPASGAGVAFVFNFVDLPVEDSTWGGVKGMYR